MTKRKESERDESNGPASPEKAEEIPSSPTPEEMLVVELRRAGGVKDIRLSNAHFRAALADSNITVFSKNKDLRFTWCYNSLCGIAPKSLIGKRLPELIGNREDAENDEAKERSVIETGVGFRQEVRLRHNDSTWWYLETVEPLRDGNEIAGIICSAVDITNEKAAAAREKFLLDFREKTRSLDEPELMISELVSNIGGFLNVNCCAYGEFLEETKQLRIYPDYCDDTPSIAGTYDLGQISPTVMEKLSRGERVVLNDLQLDECIRSDAPSQSPMTFVNSRAILMVPLFRQDRLVAVLILHQATPKRWDPQDIGLVEQLVSMVHFAIDSARSREKLTRSEAMFRSVYQNAGVGIAIVSDEHLFQNVNDKFAAIIGYLPAEVIGKTWMELTHPKDLDADLGMATRLAIGDIDEYTMEKRYLHKLGFPTWINLTCSLFEPSKDGPHRFLVISQDINERKRLESELRESENRFRDIANASPLAIWQTNAAGKTEYVNRSWLDFTGLNLPRVQRTGWLPEIHPDDRASARAEMLDPMAKNRDFRADFRLRRHDGVWRWFMIVGIARFLEDETFVGYLGSSVDITDRLEYEEMLREVNRDLELFAYAASHDLKAPLRAITGYLRILQEKHDDSLHPEILQLIRLASDNSEHMTTLVNDLLAFSQIRGEKGDFRDVPMARVIARALQTLRVEVEESQVSVILPEDLPIVYGDETLLVQLFQNLLGNAIKFRGEAEPTIRLEARRQQDDWHFQVIDNGIGIDPKFHERVFDIFKRLHGASRFPGTGIGLAMCRKIVEYHGGRIGVQSVPGDGATFWFTLPTTLR